MLDGLNNANINVGANTVNIGSQSAIVRSVGQIRTMDDIRNTMLTVRDGAPVLVSDVATVTVGNQPRLGIAGQSDDDDIVQGIVLMRRGAETMPTLDGVLAEVDKINKAGVLPAGVRIERIYDRSALVDITTHTVLHNMVMGVTLIFLIQWLFLGDLRSAMIVSATIPFALLFAVVILVLSGESANLLSMGAIDFGIIVDATVIMVENIFRHLSEVGHAQSRPLRPAPEGLDGKLATIFHASTEVTQAIFFSATIIIAGFLPLVHPVGRRRPHLRPDGPHLCLRPVRRPFGHLHGLAGACRPAAAREGAATPRPARCARCAAATTSCASWCSPIAAPPWPPASALPRSPSWPAAPSAWNSCPSSRKATCGSGPSCRPRSRWRPATTTPTACAA